MAELIRGTVFDRPWGRTLATLGLRGVTGQLTMWADGKNYEIAFSNGAVIAASSPIASDAAVRVALTGGLVSTTQVAELARKQAAAPGRDEVDVITEHLRIGSDQAMRLRRRTIAQRAARTFSVDKGEFVVMDQITLPVVSGSDLDVRAIVYLGARQNLSEARLASELGLFGTWFRLKPEAFEDLPYFGFTDTERPLIDALMNGASLGELEEIEGMDSRIVRATVYALCSANACNVEQTRGQPTKPPPTRQGAGSDPGVRRGAGSDPGVRRAQTEPGVRRAQTEPGLRRPSTPPATQPAPRTKAPTAQPIVAYNPGIRRSASKSSPPPNTTSTPVTPTSTPPKGTTIPPATRSHPALDPSSSKSDPGLRRAAPTSIPPRTTSPTASPRIAAKSSPPTNNKLASADEVQQLIGARAKLLEQGADHYALLGVAPTATAEEIRKTYFNLARNLHPDRLTALGIADDAHVAHKVFAQLNTAFAILSDAKRRADYDSVLGRGGEGAMREEQARAEEMTMRILQAEEAFKRGELALKRNDLVTAFSDLARAVELNPDEPDFFALHAWALFCAASDKNTVARQTRATLERAIQKSPRAINPRFYLGRVERMLGRDKEALDLFRDVLVDKPHHAEAQSEVRAIEARLATNAPKGGGGLFGRKR